MADDNYVVGLGPVGESLEWGRVIERTNGFVVIKNSSGRECVWDETLAKFFPDKPSMDEFVNAGKKKPSISF